MTLRRAALLSMTAAAVALFLQARAQAGRIEPGPPVPPSAAAPVTPPELRRAPEQTYLTFPEWFLVYSPDEYATFIASAPPSAFPWLGHIGQLWQGYRAIHLASRDDYPFNSEYHTMIWVIATSTTAEYSVKGAYEVLIGRVTELFQSRPSAEDQLAARVARSYVEFLDVEPWYKFDFLTPLRDVWTSTAWFGIDVVRKWERKSFLSAEYLFKAGYAAAIKRASQSAYGMPEPTTAVVIDRKPDELGSLREFKVLSRLADGSVLATVPRYQAFTDYARALVARGITLREIAGNAQPLLISILVSEDFDAAGLSVLMRQRLLTVPGRMRLLVTVKTAELGPFVERVGRSPNSIEHIYDY